MNRTESGLRGLLRTELTRAMKHHDQLATAALRSAIGAIDGAEAVPTVQTPSAEAGPIAGAVVGLGTAEVPRRDLTAQDVVAVLENEIAERHAAADEIEAAGRPEHAANLRREAEVIASVLRSA